MITGIRLATKYALFCAVSMALNLGSQYAADVAFAPPLWISMAIGTAIGLLAKYILDRNYIFGGRGVSLGKDANRFMAYTAMGIVTTLLFWGIEWAFAAGFEADWAKYAGGGVGLTLGYFLKYHLDRRWVFVGA